LTERGFGISDLRIPDFLQVIDKGEEGFYKFLKYSTAIS
jgi:hypothetical protein